MGDNDRAYLILENGTVFEGNFFGAQGEITGELVFATGMTGYLETFTDQSYYGQIVLQTFPLIGNYGVIPEDFESSCVGPRAYIVKYPCETPSNFRSRDSLGAFLKERGIIGLHGIDTRSLTKIIRQSGVMNGKISPSKPSSANLDQIRDEIKKYSIVNPIAAVSRLETITLGNGGRKIALLDFGAKRGMLDALVARNCEVWIFPYNTSAEEIMKVEPDGILLSNGPGDPADSGNRKIVDTIRDLITKGIPIFGICMGHQLLALANGYKTRKLKFGHRGTNQPVKDTQNGRVYITSQNHGYEVIADSLTESSAQCVSSFVNVNDGSCEGLDYGVSFSVQFHPEARGGPLDTNFLFDVFLKRIDDHAAK